MSKTTYTYKNTRVIDKAKFFWFDTTQTKNICYVQGSNYYIVAVSVK